MCLCMHQVELLVNARADITLKERTYAPQHSDINTHLTHSSRMTPATRRLKDTPIMLAGKNVSMVRLLVAKGATINARNG